MTKRFLPRVAAVVWLGLLAVADRASAQSKPNVGSDNPTAYTAMRAISKDLGRDALERVVEVTGREGAPQPLVWKIVLKEGAGSREVDVAGGRITAQRELTRPPASSTPIRLADLNLDSSGAFDAVDVQAKKVKLRYDSLDFDLRVSPATGKPVWHIDLHDKEGAEVGTIRLAAHDGTVISTEGRLAHNNPPLSTPPPARSTVSTATVADTTVTTRSTPVPRATPRPAYRPATPRETSVTTTTVRRTTPPPAPPTTTTTTLTTTQQNIPVATLSDREEVRASDDAPEPRANEGGLFTRTGRTLDRTSHTVERGFRKAGASVQRFFTGHSDLDQESQPDRSYRPDPRTPNLPD